MKAMTLLVAAMLLLLVVAHHPTTMPRRPQSLQIIPCEDGESMRWSGAGWFCSALPCRSWESFTLNSAGRLACRLADRHRGGGLLPP